MFAEIEFRSDALIKAQCPATSTPSAAETARTLANLCWNPGQVSKFFSVAQHNVLLSRLVPTHLAMEALFLSPPNAVKTGAPPEVHPDIGRAARILQGVVERDLCPMPGPFMSNPNEIIFGPLPIKIEAATPEEAFHMFLARHRLLAYRHHLHGSAQIICLGTGKSHRP